jgi:hypothetical protein
MQYKIPVQIENEDPIVFWLSLRQLIIIIIWLWLWYSLFTSLEPTVWIEMAAIPWIIIFVIAIIIAVFRYAEMSFTNFILSFIRYKVNYEERRWIKWIDNFQPIDIWYQTSNWSIKEEKIHFTDKIDKIKEMENKLNKI